MDYLTQLKNPFKKAQNLACFKSQLIKEANILRESVGEGS